MPGAAAANTLLAQEVAKRVAQSAKKGRSPTDPTRQALHVEQALENEGLHTVGQPLWVYPDRSEIPFRLCFGGWAPAEVRGRYVIDHCATANIATHCVCRCACSTQGFRTLIDPHETYLRRKGSQHGLPVAQALAPQPSNPQPSLSATPRRLYHASTNAVAPVLNEGFNAPMQGRRIKMRLL